MKNNRSHTLIQKPDFFCWFSIQTVVLCASSDFLPAAETRLRISCVSLGFPFSQLVFAPLPISSAEMRVAFRFGSKFVKQVGVSVRGRASAPAAPPLVDPKSWREKHRQWVPPGSTKILEPSAPLRPAERSTSDSGIQTSQASISCLLVDDPLYYSECTIR